MTDVEVVFYEITCYIQTNYPKLMCNVYSKLFREDLPWVSHCGQ